MSRNIHPAKGPNRAQRRSKQKLPLIQRVLHGRKRNEPFRGKTRETEGEASDGQ